MDKCRKASNCLTMRLNHLCCNELRWSVVCRWSLPELRPWRWRQFVLPKCGWPLTKTRCYNQQCQTKLCSFENCALLRYYAASNSNSLSTFRDNLSLPLNTWPTGCPETSVRNYHYSLRNSPEGSSSPLLRGGNLKSRHSIVNTNTCTLSLVKIY